MHLFAVHFSVWCCLYFNSLSAHFLCARVCVFICYIYFSVWNIVCLNHFMLSIFIRLLFMQISNRSKKPRQQQKICHLNYFWKYCRLSRRMWMFVCNFFFLFLKMCVNKRGAQTKKQLKISKMSAKIHVSIYTDWVRYKGVRWMRAIKTTNPLQRERRKKLPICFFFLFQSWAHRNFSWFHFLMLFAR